MPNGYYSPYQDAAQAFGGVGGQLNDIVVGLAQQRYQQAQLREQRQTQREQFQQEMALKKLQAQQSGELNKQRGALYESQRGLNDQKQIGLANDQNTGQQLGNTLEGMVNAENNPNAPYDMERLQALLAKQSGQLAASGKRFVPENVAQIRGLGNERERMMMATGTKPQQSMPSQGVSMDILTGLINEIAPQKLNQGQVLSDVPSGKVIAQGLPPRPSYPPTSAGQTLSKNNALTAFMSDNYADLRPDIQQLILSALTNKVQQVTGPVPAGVPPQVGQPPQGMPHPKSRAEAEAIPAGTDFWDEATQSVIRKRGGKTNSAPRVQREGIVP